MCAVQDAGTIDLYFYGELQPRERESVDDHLRLCRECVGALEQLHVIRAVLARQPDVAAPASGDWSGFMEQLDSAVRGLSSEAVVVPFEAGAAASSVRLQAEASRGTEASSFHQKPGATRGAKAAPFRARTEATRSVVGLLATAALLAIVAISVFFASQAGRRAVPSDNELQPAEMTGIAASDQESFQAGFASVGARHFERSKLVVLGLATREAAAGDTSDWAYERQLATGLLNDTRLYRMAAEQRGMTALAGVLRDLELVLLQTSMAEVSDETALPQIQRLIRKRGLVQKMDVVGTTGLVP